jgi:hypothetical protein
MATPGRAAKFLPRSAVAPSRYVAGEPGSRAKVHPFLYPWGALRPALACHVACCPAVAPPRRWRAFFQPPLL